MAMSRRIPEYSPRALTNTFVNKLGIRFRSRKHRVGWYRLDGKDTIWILLPKKHGRWSPAVQRDLIEKTRLTPDEFKELVGCSMSESQYADRLREIIGKE